MGWYLYCLGGVGHPEPEDVAGIAGAPVRPAAAAGFVAWVSELDAPPAPSLDAIRVHNRVVELATRDRTPLPLRFGQWFQGPDDLETALLDRREALEAGLERVRDAIEFGVRILDAAAPPDPPDRSSGRAYLETLARRDRRSEQAARRAAALADELRDWLGPRIRDQRAGPGGAGPTLVVLAHLVERHDTASYGARVREFPRRHPDLRFVFTGPWPPYGFVDTE